MKKNIAIIGYGARGRIYKAFADKNPDLFNLVAVVEVDKNKVVKTSPSAGKKAKLGATVTIYKSSGEETFELEDYTGKNYIEVRTILTTQYGLKVRVEKKEVADNSRDYDEQEIIGQSVAA